MLEGSDRSINRVTVSLRFVPVKMVLDPSESINNMGNLRVDVLDADNLPAADRNGYSDPFCRFQLNGKEVYKTKIQKRTLHPAWNEFFECPIPSRTGANFKVKVMDWDMGDKDDLLGEATINLEILDPFRPKETVLNLDGKSGVLRLKLLFKPDYVTRRRIGSSTFGPTFSGTFATPGKVIGAPVKGVGIVGGGVVKGASFLKKGFSRNKPGSPSHVNGGIPATPEKDEPITDGVRPGDLGHPGPPFASDARNFSPMTPPHSRTRSIGAASAASGAPGGGPSKTETGRANFTILSASGFPVGAKIQVHIRQMTAKGEKDVHKTKSIKSASGHVAWDQSPETCRVPCAPDTQFRIKVKDDKLLKDEDLGEAMFFIDDSFHGSERDVPVGEGTVRVKTAYTMDDDGASLLGGSGSVKDSPRHRRSFIGRSTRATPPQP